MNGTPTEQVNSAGQASASGGERRAVDAQAGPESACAPADARRPPTEGSSPPTKRRCMEELGEAHRTPETDAASSKHFHALLCRGRDDFKGIICERGPNGATLEAHRHQRLCVKAWQRVAAKAYVVAHDPGLGKTTTTILMIGALACLNKRVPKVLISIPAKTLGNDTDGWTGTIRMWLNVPESRWLISNKGDHFTRQAVKEARIVVTTHSIVQRAFCLEKDGEPVGCFMKGKIGRKSGYVRNEAVELHPLYAADWDLLVVDEVQNVKGKQGTSGFNVSAWAHHCLSKNAARRVALSGTPVENSPDAAAGVSFALDAPALAGLAQDGSDLDFQDVKAWRSGDDHKTVCRDTVDKFVGHYLHRAKAADHEGSLPPLHEETLTFRVDVPPSHIGRYNELVDEISRLHGGMGKQADADLLSSTNSSVVKLASRVTKLKQILVSPVLYELKAEAFEYKSKEQNGAREERLSRAVAQPSATLRALVKALRELMVDSSPAPHPRVIVVCEQTAMLAIGRYYVEAFASELGQCFTFQGDGMSQKARDDTKAAFLRAGRSVLFLSRAAGGEGVDGLQRGCEALVFWGNLPWASSKLKQATKRVHRFGQTSPITGGVTIKHLVAHGSPDYALTKLHEDKVNLIDLFMDGDDSNLDECAKRRSRRSSPAASTCRRFPPSCRSTCAR